MRYPLAFMLAAMCIASAPAKRTHVTWENTGNRDGRAVQRITVTGDCDFSRLCFNSLDNVTPLNPADTIVPIFPGYSAIASPRFTSGIDSLVIELSSPALTRAQNAPDGAHRVNRDGTTEAVDYMRISFTSTAQWADGSRDAMPYGDEIFAINETIRPSAAPGAYDVVPSFKKVSLGDGVLNLPARLTIKLTPMPDGHYRITVGADGITVEAADATTARNAAASFRSQVMRPGVAALPLAVIEDWPDMDYRGMMIDIVRNYQTPDQLHKLLRQMRDLRLNVLHFHFADDEAWRLEMPSLPELTSMASRRGYSLDDADFLGQAYRGDGNPDSYSTTGNGFYTRQEFIDLLRAATDMGITVLPEVESPGHARAAIKAMEHRARTTGDTSYRLIHDGDTSKYSSAQNYHDCVMNPALEGPYKFMGAVFDDLIAMYDEAGAPLPAIHIGGDEVAHGSWNGSDAAKKFMADNGIKDEKGLHAHFVNRIRHMLAERGLKMSGWQEISQVQGDEGLLADQLHSVNFWINTSPANTEAVRRSAQAGCPVIVTNVDYFYFDQPFNKHPEEPGLPWGGYVDDLRTLNGYPRSLYPADIPLAGLSTTLFAETIDGPAMQDRYIFPKVLGAAERAWNNDSTYTDPEFIAVMSERFFPAWERARVDFHVRQPGIKVENGTVTMNSPYRNATIRYTTDGTEPTETSAVYTAPFAANGSADIRARLFINGRQSLTTYTRR